MPLSDTQPTKKTKRSKKCRNLFATNVGVTQNDGLSSSVFIKYLDEALKEVEETLSSCFKTDHSHQQNFSAPGTHGHHFVKKIRIQLANSHKTGRYCNFFCDTDEEVKMVKSAVAKVDQTQI